MKIIGLPLTVDSMTDEFKSIIDSQESRVLVLRAALNMADPTKSNDYMCAQAGFDYVYSSGYQFVMHDRFNKDLPHYRHVVMCPFWYGADGVRRRPAEVIQHLSDFIVDIQCENVDFIVQGSPTLWDHVAPWFVERGAQIVDTPSSADLAIQEAKAHLTLETCILRDPYGDRLKNGVANVVGCVGDIYRSHKREELRDDIASASKVFVVTVGEGVEQRDPELAANQMFAGSSEFNRKVLIVEKV
jgi:hypothetical protein